jgi:ADP-heptose:LPS heptosyltransferase
LPNNLGDIIMATPALEGLRARDPESRIVFFAEEGFEAGIVNNSHIDEIVRFPRKAIRDAFINKQWRDGSQILIHCIDALRGARFTRAINLSQHDYTASLIPLMYPESYTGRGYIREGNDALPDAWSQYLYAIPFAREYNAFHAADVYRRIAGASTHRGGYTIALTDAEKSRSGEYLRNIGVDTGSGRIIVFQPGAALSSKRWPVDHFVALGRMLASRNWQVIVSGAPAERDAAQAITERIGAGGFCTAGETTFREAVANCSFARGCVTGDTALMHAAAALDKEVFAIFGATSPQETGPYGNGHFVFSGTCARKPCFCNTCTSGLCMKSILPETVFSCVENGAPPPNPRCDVYRTAIEPDSDYALIPKTRDAFRYHNAAGVALIRRAFGENPVNVQEPATDELQIVVEESRGMLAILYEMESHLAKYQKTHDTSCIHEFEREKDILARFTGIGRFWAALLNLRLNSVPILDAQAGVDASARMCAGLAELIRHGCGL